MSGLIALAFSIGGLGAVATWLSLVPLAGMVTIWAIFIAWASYFHNGADGAAARNTLACTVLGSVLAGVTFVFITHVGLGSLPVTASVWVGVFVFIMVCASKIPAFSVIPCLVYGFAATAAFAIHAEPGLGATAKTLAMDFSNPVLVISLSLIIGTVFGVVSGKLAGILTKS
jgi:hypothetical protein